MASTPLVGISAIVITPSPIAVASDVKDIAGISDGFIERSIRASAANKGPTIISGFCDNALFIAAAVFAPVSKNDTDRLCGARCKTAVSIDVFITRPVAALLPDNGNKTAMRCGALSVSVCVPYIVWAGPAGASVPYSPCHVLRVAVVAHPVNSTHVLKKPKILFICIEKSILFCIILL